MPRNWQDGLRFLREQFDKISLPQCDLWHGWILRHESSVPNPAADPWGHVRVHEPLACKPWPGSAARYRDPDHPLNERFFGEASALAEFRSLATEAFKLVADRFPPKKLPAAICLAGSEADKTASWVYVLYSLAWHGKLAAVAAPKRRLILTRGWGQDAELVSGLEFAFLSRNVFAVSVAALDWFLRRAVGTPKRVGTVAAPEKPVWDEGRQTLSWKGRVVKRYGRPAKNQIDILEAFQKAGWPFTIPDPFRDHAKLKQTVKDLNRALRWEYIQFRLDGTGEGVNWEPARRRSSAA